MLVREKQIVRGSLRAFIVQIMNAANQPHNFDEMIRTIHKACEYPGHQFCDVPREEMTTKYWNQYRVGEARTRLEYRAIYKDREELAKKGVILRSDFILAKPEIGYRPRMVAQPGDVQEVPEPRANAARLALIKAAALRRKNRDLSTVTAKIEKIAAAGLHRQAKVKETIS
jgi:hypothetical protein